MRSFVFSTFFSMFLLSPLVQIAVAEDFYCAAVLPCNAAGDVIPPFNDPTSGCLKLYEGQCRALAVKRVDDKLASCEDNLDKIQTERRRASRRVRYLRRKVQRLSTETIP